MRSAPIEAGNNRIEIGSRIRAARQQQQMTIDDVAQASGVTRGFLSRVERDLASPSVATLIALCDVLSLDVGSLFQAPDVHLVRHDERLRLNLGGVDSTDRLITPRRESRVQVVRSEIADGGHGGEERYSLAAEVEVVHVLSGRIEVEFSHESLVLETGDSLTFDGREPHTWRSVGGEAEVIWVLTPALWSA
ncbi:MULTISPECIES: helix-turn-helix domain-containing protein [unclassified Microbacterium]|uniref:helix-turn-helix domain-containing protein n=1 Tax=unclassified Microbacterium TaxID=2609290 RepID=UPI003019A7D9